MKNNKIGCLLLLLALGALSWGIYYARYHYSYYRDLQEKPWAYSRDSDAKLLVGQWKGSFTDPNGVVKKMDLEILPPMTDEERKERASSYRRRKRSVGALRKDKRHFDGFATVSSALGTEKYNFYGYVGEENFHEFKMTFGYEDEAKKLRSNFALNLGQEGNWQDDQLKMTLHFSYISESGSSFWDSANPKHEQTSLVTFHRK